MSDPLVALSTVALHCRVNGATVQATVRVEQTLADFLREDLALTGTKIGCSRGVCGACVTLVDGQPVAACSMFAESTIRRPKW